MNRQLFYGDNLEVLQKYIADDTIDLCYIDPPFNSKRNYNQIYNNIGKEDQAQAQAFTDTWVWSEAAEEGYQEIVGNLRGLYTSQTVYLVIGLSKVLDKGSLLAYVINLTRRCQEIHRILKPTGSFYFHCDSTASHYLKLVLDSIFLPRGGEFRNEIAWCYRKWSIKASQFARNHDTILFYTKSNVSTFNTLFAPLSEGTLKRWKGKKQVADVDTAGRRIAKSEDQDSEGSPLADWWELSIINPQAKERLGYPTQKPEKLLEKIILASTNEGDTVLDCYCGCGTTVAVAERLGRKWIGVDITYQSISLIIKRLEDSYGAELLDQVVLNGIPKDWESAKALSLKKDDRVRKEFEKWAVLTYSNNRAMILEKKGADAGIDGKAIIVDSMGEYRDALFSVKSGERLGVKEIRDFRGVIERENAAVGIFITLYPPTKPMLSEAITAGKYHNPLLNRSFDRIQVITIEEIMDGARMDLPSAVDVVKSAERRGKKTDAGTLF